MTAIVATGLVKGGRLDLRNRKQFEAQLRRLRDGAIQITVERVHATRSLQQSRWYWGVIVELISDHTGYTPDEVHELLKAKFLPKKLAVTNGNGVIVDELVIGGSSAKLDKNEFSEYCEAIRRWAAEELDVVIPDPDAGALWPGAGATTEGVLVANPDLTEEQVERLRHKPAKGSTLLAARERRAKAKAHEAEEKAKVVKRDGNKACRLVPTCQEREKFETAHLDDKGMGGDHGIRTTADRMIRSCFWHHQGVWSLHSKDLRVDCLTDAGTYGPVEVWARDENQQWYLLKRETAANVVERD